MKLHTGETVAEVTPDWSWEQRQKLGQKHLEDLAEDLLNDGVLRKSSRPTLLDTLIKNLELSGYEYKDSRLIRPEQDILDVEEPHHSHPHSRNSLLSPDFCVAYLASLGGTLYRHGCLNLRYRVSDLRNPSPILCSH